MRRLPRANFEKESLIMKKTILQKVAGFTLVELLVVISIIALLLSILMPALSKARRSAQKTACMANMKQIGIAINIYTSTNRDIMPMIVERWWGGGFVPGLENGGDGWNWAGELLKAANIPMNMFRCPGDHRKYKVSESSFYVSSPNYFSYGGVFIGYAQTANTKLRVPWSCPTDSSNFPARNCGPLNSSRIRSPSQMMMVFDSVMATFSGGMDVKTQLWIWSGDMTVPRNLQQFNEGPFRHNNIKSPYSKQGRPFGRGPNCLFADGHVEGSIVFDNIKPENVGTK